MKKDKKWLKEEIESKFHRWYDSAQTLNSLIANINNLIDQLDEPEVLSQEWIDEHIDYADVRGDTSVYTCIRLTKPTRTNSSEMETVADVIADFFKSLERLKEVMSMEVEELEE